MEIPLMETPLKETSLMKTTLINGNSPEGNSPDGNSPDGNSHHQTQCLFIHPTQSQSAKSNTSNHNAGLANQKSGVVKTLFLVCIGGEIALYIPINNKLQT